MVESALAFASTPAAQAAHELAQLRRELAHARAELADLQTAIALAAPLAAVPSLPELQEANEQLLLSALRIQKEAERAALAAAHSLRFASTASNRDPLTGLPNRSLLLDRLAQAITAASRHGRQVALLYIDLKAFRRINSSFGHATGDKLLQRIAQRLAASVRAADTVSHHDGDEFLVLMTDVRQHGDANSLADALTTALALPNQIGEHLIGLEANIGIGLYPDDGQDAAAVIARAEAAMVHARHHGLRRFAFQPEPVALAALAAPAPAVPASLPEDTRSEGPLARRAHEAWRDQLHEANEQLVLAALTAQALQASAEEAQARQMEVLTVVAHELRNPLAPLRIAATLLLKGRPEDARLRQLQAIIERQVSHLSRLVGDLLDVSRSHSGKLRIERQTVHMAALIDEAVACCKPAMEVRSQQLAVTVAAGPLDVDGDPLRLMQVLCNLLDNASKYTPIGGEIVLSASASAAVIVLKVADNGIGITAEALPRVFEPFVQDPHAIGFNGAGLGIGLTVVRELVGAHGGRVEATSAGMGHGSQFTVTLPLMQS